MFAQPAIRRILDAALVVQIAAGLVEQQHAAAHSQHAGQRQPLLLAAEGLRDQPIEAIEQRRLAAAGPADQGNQFAWLHVQIDVVPHRSARLGAGIPQLTHAHRAHNTCRTTKRSSRSAVSSSCSEVRCE